MDFTRGFHKGISPGDLTRAYHQGISQGYLTRGSHQGISPRDFTSRCHAFISAYSQHLQEESASHPSLLCRDAVGCALYSKVRIFRICNRFSDISSFDSVIDEVSVAVWGRSCKFVVKSIISCSGNIRIEFDVQNYLNKDSQVMFSLFFFCDSGGPCYLWQGHGFRREIDKFVFWEYQNRILRIKLYK